MEVAMVKIAVMAGISLLALGIAGCGTTTSDRTLSGAGLGAGAGALGAAAAGGSVGTGAIVGGVVGGVIGAATTPDQIYLGDPVWRKKCEERRHNGEHVDCSKP